MGLGKLMPIKLLRPSDASTARPIACPGGGVRKITCEVPAMIRAEARALAGPMASRCLATISSGLIFSARDAAGEAKASARHAAATHHICRDLFLRSII